MSMVNSHFAHAETRDLLRQAVVVLGELRMRMHVAGQGEWNSPRRGQPAVESSMARLWARMKSSVSPMIDSISPASL
jgi:hypothetical protein